MPEAIRTVAVIGAGQQGRAFALHCAEAGYLTVLEDVLPARLRQAREELESRGEPEASGRLRLAVTVEEAVRDADLVIDFVPDELESKLEIFSMIDRMAPPRTLLCTPTFILSIGDLASCTYRGDLCVGLRGTPPTCQGELVTLIQSHLTASDTTERVHHFFQSLGFAVASETEDAPAFATSASM